ncbi:hypothetical protein [Massilia sp. ST3]|uniref:hypothetical protein n=1 Tax=Massilia sp. ST3 TaxID=2824903 RepID=UPI001B83F9FD|nr:hypothetical protein [Massilia sp. ST3]MBQ5947840.1 hypothetical protein [Massilia sp. ST3]
MPITRDKDFLRWPDAPGFPAMGIESARLAECSVEVQRSGVKQVFGAPEHGFTETHLDFLAQLPTLEGVWFWNVALDNIDGLYALTKLRRFGMHPKRPPIQFDRFPALESAVVELRPQDSGLDRLASLNFLSLWRYKGKECASLPLAPSLTELQLHWASTESLADLPSLPELRRLEIHRCRKLHSLGAFKEKFPKLEHLVIDACGRVTKEEGARAIEGLTELRHACVQDALLV